MSAPNVVVSKPLFGLPLNLINAEGRATPLLLKMVSLGLNRDRKRKMTAKWGEYSSTITVYGKEFSDSDAKLIARYQSPAHRNLAFWRAVDSKSKGDTTLATHYSVRSPELALLREYAPDLHSGKFDEAVFEEACPIWPELLTRLKRARSYARDPEDFRELMVWLRICEDLERWEEFDEPARLKLVNAVFAMMTIGNTAWFIEEALARCPGVEPYFEALFQLNAEREGSSSANDDPKIEPDMDESQIDLNTEGAAPDVLDQSDPEQLWHAALARLANVVAALQVAPDLQILSELHLLCDQLHVLAPQLSQLERRAEEDFQNNLQTLQRKLASFVADDVLDWFDAEAGKQLVARWEIARAACADFQAIADLAVDCGRANIEGDSTHASIRSNAEEGRAISGEISSLEGQRESLTALGPRRALGQQLISLRQRHSESEAVLQQLQDRFLAELSPWSQPFDLDTDYIALFTASIGGILPSGSDGEMPIVFEHEAVAESEGRPCEPIVDTDSLDSTVCEERSLPALSEPNLPVAAVSAHPDIVATAELFSEASTSAVFGDEQAIQTVVGAFNVEAGESCRPIWRALADDHCSFAYQLARAFDDDESAPLAPPPSLLACVAIADHVVLPDGAIVATLSQHYQTLKASTVPDDAPDDWRTAISVLTAAATLRPLLMAPSSGAADVVRDLHLDNRHQSVYQLLRMLGSHSERLQGFRLEVSTFKGTRTEAAWQQEVNSLKREAQEWIEQAQHLTMIYSPTTKVWLHWLKPDALVQRLVSPVACGTLDKLAPLKELIAELGQPGSFEKQVQHADRRELGRLRGEDIQARALVQISGRLEEAVSLARRWVLLVESRPQASDALDRRLNALRTDIFAMRQQITADLSKPLDRDDWQLVGTARAVLSRSLKGLWDLFDPACPPRSLELRPEELLGQDLLLFPMVEMDSHWQPELRGQGLVQQLIGAAAAKTPENAFAERLARDDLEGSERLLEVMEREVGNADTVGLRELWHQRLVERQAALRRQIDVVRAEAETGVAYGMITEAERAAFDAQLVHMETSLESIRRFWAAFELLSGLSAQIAMRRLEKTEAVRVRLDDLAARGPASDDVSWVREALLNGDVLTANELLQRLERGETLDRQAHILQDRFAAYFPQHANQIDALLDALNPTELRQKIGAAENFAALDFSNIPVPQMRQAGEMVSSWLTIKSRRNSAQELLKKLLDALGFEVLSLAAGANIGHRAEYELSTVPIDDRGLCPIPYFGSYANGRYRLVCVWQRPAEEDIVKLVGDSTIHRPTILLYFGRLTERKRRDASRLAKLQHRSFLLIDETLLVSLTAEGGSRLAALFETALPFAYSAPYDATSSVVPSEMFYGRLHELQAIQGQNGRCFIYGGRQLGKTALLRKAEKTFHSPQQRRYAKWIDLRAEGIGVNRAPAEVWLCIARELRAAGMINNEIPEPNPNIKGRVESFVRTLKDMLAPSSDSRVLLLLDESDRFFELDRSNDFAETRRLKEVMEQTDRRFKVVFAGLHNVLRMTEDANHPLAHLGEPIKVGPLLEGLEWRDAEDLIRKPLEAAGFAFESRDLITRVLAQTNYYPSLIQLYCSHLLRQMLATLRNDPRLTGPRHIIQARHVDAAYKNAVLRDEIRTKFNLTLQLDPRYEVIAYTLAYGAMQGRNVVPDGASARDAKAQVTRWWPDGFANTSDLEFRVLLDEMVGLGVLRETRQGSYALRNPNVLLLLGNQEEVEDVLIKDRELPQEFDPSTFRARLAHDSGNPKRHPLTFQQLAAITRPVNAVTILSGSRAAGMDDILIFLRESIGEKFLLLIDNATDLTSFKFELDRLKDRAESGTTVVLVPIDVPWRQDWVTNASERLSRLSAKDRHAHVIFLRTPAHAWEMIASGEENEDVNHMSLLPWQDSFVRQWMEDCGLSNDQALRRTVFDASGYWPHLLYKAGLGGRDGGRIAERLDALRASFVSPIERDDLLGAFGLDLPAVQTVMNALAQFGDEIDESELAQLIDVDPLEIGIVLRWARTMQLVTSVGIGRWHVESTVRVLLQTQTQTQTRQDV